jgi:hypothetical protein
VTYFLVEEGARKGVAIPFSSLVRWGGWAGMLGGLLWALFPLATVLVSMKGTQPGTTAHIGAAAVYWLMAVLPLLLLLVGLVGLRALHSGAYGRLGNIGFLTCFVALALMFVGNAIEIASLTFYGTESDVGHLVFLIGFLILLLGSVLLGIALVRTQRAPSFRLGGLLLVLALPLGIVLAVVLGAIAPRTDLGFWAAITVPYGVAWLLLGYALMSARGRAAEQPSRVR